MNPNELKKVIWLQYLGIILIAVSIMWIGNYFIHQVIETMGNNSGNNLPIYSVETDEKVVAISFDAAWGNQDTGQILDILDKYDVKATFFLVGCWIDKYPDDVKEIYKRGHDIGNHSTSHYDMAALTSDEIKQELYDTHKKIFDLIGYNMFLFRAPYGSYNENLLDTAKECDYYTIQWDVDSLDWKEYGVDHEVKTVLEHKNLKNGSILLFHNDTKFTPDALTLIIEGLQSQGYKIIPLSELIIQGDYRIDHTGRQFNVKSNIQKELQ